MEQQKLGLKNLINSLHKCTQIQYNGKLNIKGKQQQEWSIYFRLGRIIWATGGQHPFRRWRRQMACYCSQINLSEIPLSSDDLKVEYWDYILLNRLFSQLKIELKQVNNVVEGIISEILFDISHESIFNSITVERFQGNFFEKPISLASTHICIKIMLQSKKDWAEAGLAGFSPNSALLISNPEQLRKNLNPTDYKNFVDILNGQYTLRDLTIKIGRSELSISSYLLPHILKGIIKLVEVPDFPLQVNQSNKKSGTSKTKTEKIPLIACVDDSPQVCQMVEKIVRSRGFKFISITNSTEALSILLKQKPDLIFLDLVMPVVSGYEICTQLRRTSVFRNIPVIIISASESLMDRVRAEATKVMGATDFINKPIVKHKVVKIMDKCLHS
ncbi:MAG: response regulator [Calothrix sp. MO_167.B12]|nr:response regulator [Calothrix sp. MO_167.B12]